MVVSSLLEAGVDTFGVYNLDEAERVSVIAPESNILMIGPLLKADIKQAVDKGYVINLTTRELVDEVLKYENARVDLSIDMGFKRGNIAVEEVSALIDRLKDKVELYGLSTHFPLPTNKVEVEKQISTFNSLKQYFPHFKYIHMENTITFLHELNLGNMIRIGGALYGLVSYPDTNMKGLEQIASFKSKVLLTSNAQKGELVGYGDTAPYDTKTALIGAGYSDGLDKDLTGKSYVLIKDHKCPILSITMNSSIVSIPTEVIIEAGDEVVISDSNLTLMEISKLTGRRTYHLMFGFHCPVKYI